MDMSTSPISESVFPFAPPIESTPKPRRVKTMGAAADRRTPSPEGQDVPMTEAPKDSPPTSISPLQPPFQPPPQKVFLPAEMAMDYDSNSSRESAESSFMQQSSSVANELTTASTTPVLDEKSSTSIKLEPEAEVSEESKRTAEENSSPAEMYFKSDHQAVHAEDNRALLLTNESEGVNRVVDPAIVASRKEGAVSPPSIVKFESNTMSPVKNDAILPPPPKPLSGASATSSRGETPPPAIKTAAGSGGIGGGVPPSALDILSNLLSSSSSSTPTSSPARGETSSSRSRAGKRVSDVIGSSVARDLTSVSLPGLDLATSSPDAKPSDVSPRVEPTESAAPSFSRPAPSAVSAAAPALFTSDSGSGGRLRGFHRRLF